MSDNAELEWIYCRVVGEPPFWMRNALPGEIDGLDPLTGCIIVHSPEERDRLDRASLSKAGEQETHVR